MVRWSIWLDNKTVEVLKTLGKQAQRPVGWLIREAVLEYVQRKSKT